MTRQLINLSRLGACGALAGIFLFATDSLENRVDTAAAQLTPAAAAIASGVEEVTPVVEAGRSSAGLQGINQSFRILEAPRLVPLTGWRITWSSIPGRIYRLQRWATDDLRVVGNPPWVDVVSVQAQAAATFTDDPTGLTRAAGFYRVELLQETGLDQTGPTVSPIQPSFAAVNGRPGVILRVRAQDTGGVTRVRFLNGPVELGEGTRLDGDEWSLNLPLNVKELGARFIVAQAVDNAGNIGLSPVFPLGLVDPDHFVPLDANGAPIEGGIVQAVAQGQWGPVEYRPGGRNLLGFGPGFFLRFPQGVFLRNLNGQQFLEFTEVIAGFGGSYPIQLDRSLHRTGGPAKQLRVGPVDLADVFRVFDLDPAAGIAVNVFTRFPLLWRGGIVDDGGIRAARFGFIGNGLPLPGTSGEYPDLVIDFTRSRGLRLPFQGEFPLIDGTSNPARLRVGAGSPLWLTLAPDGKISLVGSAGVELANGGFFRADMRFDDPFYQLQIAADRLRVNALGSLVDLLPANPTVCIPAQAADAQLAQATRCLDAFARAYQNFAASVAAESSTTGAANDAARSAPPEPINTAASVLEAWAFSALASTQTALQLDLIRDLVRQAGQSASGSHDLSTAAAFRLALMRAEAAAAQNKLSGSPESRADLTAALAEAEAAALQRAGESDAVTTLSGMREAVRFLAEAEALRQQLGRPPGPLLTEALPRLLNEFSLRYTSSIGVNQAGLFTPINNSIISGMNRFTAAEHVHTLVALMADAQLLGIALGNTLLDEALGQLATRLFFATEDSLNAAEAAQDYPGFLLALQDIIDLVAERQLAVFPDVPALAALPDTGDIAGYVNRLARL